MFKNAKNVIAGRKYIFKSPKSKKEMLDNNELSTEEQAKIIKTLFFSSKEKALKKLFNYSYEDKKPEEKSIELFNQFDYEDQVDIIQMISSDEVRNSLIDQLSNREKVRFLLNSRGNQKNRNHIISKLNKTERSVLYHLPILLYPEDTAEILKYYPEEEIKKRLLKKSGRISRLSTSAKIDLIGHLKSDEEKLECLVTPNKYNISLDNRDKVELLFSLSDKKKIEFINEKTDYSIPLSSYDKTKLMESLSDEGRLYFLDNPDEIRSFLYIRENEFFKLFSPEYSKIILINRKNYKYEIDEYATIRLVCNLNNEEKKSFIENINTYGIELDIDQKIQIACTLSDEYKMNLIREKSINGIELDEIKIKTIIKSMKGSNVICLLAFNDNIEEYLKKEDIWEIIENLQHDDVIKILNYTDERIKKFIQTYKTSFVKCLNDDEKIAIICKKSQYKIYLNDTRKIKILKTLSSSCNLKQYINDNIFKYFDDPTDTINKLIDNKNDFNKLNDDLQIQALLFIMNKKDVDEEIILGLDIIKYVPNARGILSKYSQLKQLFKILNINFYDFFQYGINSNKYIWYNDVINIIDNKKVEQFKTVKDYFFNNYYNSKNDPKYIIKNFLEILSMYNKYEQFCTQLTEKNQLLSKEEKEDINFLFNSKGNDLPNNLEELSLCRAKEIKMYKKIAQETNSLYELKNAFSKLFFNKTFDELREIIEYTGGTAELKILQFNNHNNKRITNLVDNLTIVTELIERIINTTDIIGLRKSLEFYSAAENIEHTKRISNYCMKYEEFNRELYEHDLNESLIKISNIDNSLCNTPKAKELVRKYGGTAIDLSTSQYVLAAHVQSYRENVEDLISGNSDGKSNFMCLSPISHRGQHYYGWYGEKTVFAYDTIPTNSFICSSTSNMGSNSELKYNSVEVPKLRRTQSNALETSEAKNGNNAEILLYRANLKPCGLIVPEGTEPSEKAIKYHKEFNLPFIITQPVDNKITNPNKSGSKANNNIDNSEDIETLKELKEELILKEESKTRRIAVLADPHALYEPTLACLVDIKNKGIDEIYSLGDNIGHGPNPKEVIELLNEFNVKSIYGNHELYLIDDKGIEEFKEHFPSQESIDRTKVMNEWIKKELPKEFVEQIKKYPERYEIALPNGQKITLIHTTRPYNEKGKYSHKATIDKNSFVISGHEHFASKSYNEIILRGVGIGQVDNDDGFATYTIIEILENEYCIKRVDVPYNRSNLLHTINESSMPQMAKRLITDWVGGKIK